MEGSLFLDTYALIEIAKENPHYAHLRSAKGVFTILNLLEFYYNVLIDYGERKAKELYNYLKENLVPVHDEAVFEAMEFRLKNKRLNLSYTDALGYAVARHMGIPFVTGNESFKKLAHVIFIKR